jgi:hypothetical protein
MTFLNLYEYETLVPRPIEGFLKQVLRRIFGAKREEVTET